MKHDFTGNYRLRVLTRWFRKPILVLQGEVHKTVYNNGGGRIDSREITIWVDVPAVFPVSTDFARFTETL